ncbi:hypothetical protein OAP56_02240, partial [Rickettsiaceae bacterium]|nr:hypothetical protein [Rickettsiaceae bacterium]
KATDLRSLNPSFSNYDPEEERCARQLKLVLETISSYEQREDITEMLCTMDLSDIVILMHLSSSYPKNQEDCYGVMSILEQSINEGIITDNQVLIVLREHIDYVYNVIEKRFKFENILEKHGDQIEEFQKELMGKGQQEENEQEDVDLG